MYESKFIRGMEAEGRRTHKEFMARVSAIYADKEETEELQFSEWQPESMGCQRDCFKCCCKSSCNRAAPGNQPEPEMNLDYSAQMIPGPDEQGYMTEIQHVPIEDLEGQSMLTCWIPDDFDLSLPFNIPELVQDMAVEALSQAIPVPGLGIALKMCRGYDSRD